MSCCDQCLFVGKGNGLPAEIAAMVGRIPIIPTIAVTRISISSMAASVRSPSMPQSTFTGRSATLSFKSLAASSVHITASCGRNSRICCSIRVTLVPAARAVTCRSLLFLTISSVWVPIEPVEPSTPILLSYPFYFLFIRYSTELPEAYQTFSRISSSR